jgi:hypothetical protein
MESILETTNKFREDHRPECQRQSPLLFIVTSNCVLQCKQTANRPVTSSSPVPIGLLLLSLARSLSDSLSLTSSLSISLFALSSESESTWYRTTSLPRTSNRCSRVRWAAESFWISIRSSARRLLLSKTVSAFLRDREMTGAGTTGALAQSPAARVAIIDISSQQPQKSGGDSCCLEGCNVWDTEGLVEVSREVVALRCAALRSEVNNASLIALHEIWSTTKFVTPGQKGRLMICMSPSSHPENANFFDSYNAEPLKYKITEVKLWGIDRVHVTLTLNFQFKYSPVNFSSFGNLTSGHYQDHKCKL